MALKESELRVLAIIGLVILILWAFFGLFWSLLLVFTFLIYAYNFGRHQAGNIRREREEPESENELSYQEKLRSTYQELPDLPFTGLQREKVTLRSPMPLLSEVTKRLSFNASTTTPFQGRNSWYNRDLAPTPSRGSAFTYCRKPKHFSLLNPALQRPSTVKIASPDVTVNRTFTLSNSPLKRATDDWNPCSRVTVLSALKESRKRSYVVEDDEDELTRPTKRRDTKPVDSYSFSSPLFGSRKRVIIPESTKKTPDENLINKKSKVIGDNDSSETLHSQTQKDSVIQKRKNRDSGIETTNGVANLESTETGENGSSNKKSKFTVQSSSSETVHSQIQADSVVQKRKDRTTETDKTVITQQDDAKEEGVENQSKKAKNLVQETKHDEEQRGRSEQAKQDNSCSPKQTKRFTVPRFASKEDSRRRAVPVYCASNEESEMPQRRTVSRKINQEQIKIDRRLAWERVKELLGGDEDEEEEEEAAKATRSGTTAVSSTASTTFTSSSLLKIPTTGAVTSAGTITTTTTQSLITPAPSTGVPQRITGVQGGPVTNAPVLQSQGTAVASLQSQQASGSGLLANLLSNPGSSKITSSAGGSQTATSDQAQSAFTTQTSGAINLTNAASTGFQPNVSLTSSVATTQVPSGVQLLSSASSFGNSPFTKSATTNQLTSFLASSYKKTSDTNTSSSQQAGSSFAVISSSGSSGTSSTPAGQGGLTFAAASGIQNASALGQNSTQNTPGRSLFNSTTSSALGAVSSQNPVTAPSQNPFASFAKPAQTSSVSSAVSAPSGFGQSSNAAQSSFGSTSQNKVTFGTTNMQSVLGQQSQSPFGGTPNNPSGFGVTPTFGAAVSKSSTQSPFSQGTLGAQAVQNASKGPSQKAFGAQQQNQEATGSAFGKPSSSKNAFANLTNTPGNFTFGSQVQQSATRNIFGSQTTQNAFGSQPNQITTQSAFGNQPLQNALSAQPTQSTFGLSSNQKTSSPFTFAANTTQTPSNSPFGGFGKAGTQSTFGAAPSQNAAAPSGGFNFNASGSSPAPGGFNFSATGNKPSGFQFGTTGSSSSFGQFGQTTVQPGAVPATPAPSGGFNFAPRPGGIPGSPFASPAAAPTFGVPSTPQGAGSTLTARSRARLTARRRGKK